MGVRREGPEAAADRRGSRDSTPIGGKVAPLAGRGAHRAPRYGARGPARRLAPSTTTTERPRPPSSPQPADACQSLARTAPSNPSTPCHAAVCSQPSATACPWSSHRLAGPFSGVARPRNETIILSPSGAPEHAEAHREAASVAKPVGPKQGRTERLPADEVDEPSDRRRGDAEPPAAAPHANDQPRGGRRRPVPTIAQELRLGATPRPRHRCRGSRACRAPRRRSGGDQIEQAGARRIPAASVAGGWCHCASSAVGRSKTKTMTATSGSWC